MRGFVEKNQKLGQQAIKHMVPRSRAQAWLENQMMRIMPYLPGSAFVMRMMMKPISEAANAIVLKDYMN